MGKGLLGLLKKDGYINNNGLPKAIAFVDIAINLNPNEERLKNNKNLFVKILNEQQKKTN